MALNTELHDQTKALEFKARPMEFVMHRKTSVTRQVLSRFEDPGPQSMADCGIKYSFTGINRFKVAMMRESHVRPASLR